jgi:hypothetical protein
MVKVITSRLWVRRPSRIQQTTVKVESVAPPLGKQQGKSKDVFDRNQEWSDMSVCGLFFQFDSIINI